MRRMRTRIKTPAFDWICHGCAKQSPLSEEHTCPECGEPRALYALAEPSARLMCRTPASLWHYAPLLPVSQRRCRITLGEGATPLVAAPRLAKIFCLGELQIKNEGANPTGSFKDRQVSVGISHARELGARTVAAVSSGNVATATAAYAAHAGMRAVVFMHAHAGAGKITQAIMYGATVIRVDSDAPSAVFRLCMDACAIYGWAHLSTAGMYEPYNVEGAKTIAYELFQQYKGDLPDWVVMPVGGGGLLGGVWRGFTDLQRLGLIDRSPRLVGVQAAGCAPLVKALKEAKDYLDTLKDPWPNPKTIAGGIADDILFDGHTALPAIRCTGGAAFAVPDEATCAAQKMLAEEEGLLCELTSAVVFAALEKMVDRIAGERVCCIMTGSGFKELAQMMENAPMPPVIPPDINALANMPATMGERNSL